MKVWGDSSGAGLMEGTLGGGESNLSPEEGGASRPRGRREAGSRENGRGDEGLGGRD